MFVATNLQCGIWLQMKCNEGTLVSTVLGPLAYILAALTTELTDLNEKLLNKKRIYRNI